MNEFKSIWAPLNERSHMRKATNLYNFIYMKFYLEKANTLVLGNRSVAAWEKSGGRELSTDRDWTKLFRENWSLSSCVWWLCNYIS